MPPNTDTGWSFGDLIREVAEDAGLADQSGSVPAIPSDPATLDIIKRAVNKGYREFLRIDPQWSFLNRSLVIVTSSEGTGPDCIGGDNAVVRLPRWVQGVPATPFEYIDENSIYCRLVMVDYATLQGKRQRYPEVGTPEFGCVRHIDAPGSMIGPGSGRVMALYLYPTPDAAYTLESTARVLPYDMVELEERHVAGAEHDQTIKAFALKALHSGPHEDPAKKQACIDEAALQLDISKKADARARVGIKGRVRDPLMVQRDSAGRDDHAPGDSSRYWTVYGQPMG